MMGMRVKGQRVVGDNTNNGGGNIIELWEPK